MFGRARRRALRRQLAVTAPVLEELIQAIPAGARRPAFRGAARRLAENVRYRPRRRPTPTSPRPCSRARGGGAAAPFLMCCGPPRVKTTALRFGGGGSVAGSGGSRCPDASGCASSSRAAVSRAARGVVRTKRSRCHATVGSLPDQLRCRSVSYATSGLPARRREPPPRAAPACFSARGTGRIWSSFSNTTTTTRLRPPNVLLLLSSLSIRSDL